LSGGKPAAKHSEAAKGNCGWKASVAISRRLLWPKGLEMSP
jgi:hypothetical protein